MAQHRHKIVNHHYAKVLRLRVSLTKAESGGHIHSVAPQVRRRISSQVSIVVGITTAQRPNDASAHALGQVSVRTFNIHVGRRHVRSSIFLFTLSVFAFGTSGQAIGQGADAVRECSSMDRQGRCLDTSVQPSPSGNSSTSFETRSRQTCLSYCNITLNHCLSVSPAELKENCNIRQYSCQKAC